MFGNDHVGSDLYILLFGMLDFEFILSWLIIRKTIMLLEGINIHDKKTRV